MTEEDTSGPSTAGHANTNGNRSLLTHNRRLEFVAVVLSPADFHLHKGTGDTPP